MNLEAAVESVHFPLWTYNPTTGKVKLDSADKSDTVSFAARNEQRNSLTHCR